MKKTAFRFLAVLFILLTATLTITSCSQWDDPYEGFDKAGYNVSVRYLANGGIINSGADTVMDSFRVESSIALIPPESAERGKSQCSLSHKSDYRFAGWYVAVPSTDSNGNPLDEDGNLTSESGKAQAFTAGRRWNFDSDRVELDVTKDYSATEPVLTLMAMWIPKFNFEFYAEDADGNWEIISTVQAMTLELPKWSNGKINNMGVPERNGYTFMGAYYDEQKANEITSPTISGVIDYEHGVAAESTVRIYTVWSEGSWFRIANGDELISNARDNGNYIILSDIDMQGKAWPKNFSQKTFTGKFFGNGHKISNVTATQRGEYKHSAYGLFEAIGAGAEFHDLTLENISYTVSGSLNAASFGLFAGEIADGAVFNGFSISGGELIFSDNLFEDFIGNITDGSFNIGVIAGLGTVSFTYTDVTCSTADPESGITIIVSDTGDVSFVFPDEAD